MGFWDKFFGKNTVATSPSSSIQTKTEKGVVSQPLLTTRASTATLILPQAPAQVRSANSQRPQITYSQEFIKQRLSDSQVKKNEDLFFAYRKVLTEINENALHKEAISLTILAAGLASEESEPLWCEEAILYCKRVQQIVQTNGSVQIMLNGDLFDLATEIEILLNRFYGYAATAYSRKKQDTEAVEMAQEHLEYAKCTNNTLAQLVSFKNMISGLRSQEQWQLVDQRIDEALVLAQATNERGIELDLLCMKAESLGDREEHDTAIRYFQAITALAEQYGSTDHVLSSLLNQGTGEILRGHTVHGIKAYDKALLYAKSFDNPEVEVKVCVNVAKKLMLVDLTESNRFFIIAFNHLHRVGDIPRAAEVLLSITRNFIGTTSLLEALYYAQLALRLLAQTEEYDLAEQTENTIEAILHHLNND